MALQPFKKQKIQEENDESLFLNLFDFNIIQHIFIQLPNSHIFYEDIKDCYSDCSSFSLTSKLLNSISKQTQFSIKVFQNQKINNINFDGYLKLCSILQKAIKDKTFNVKEEILNSILIFASTNGFYNVVETLILNGANPNYEDKNSCTSLCYSCQKGHYKTTKLLILNNSNVNYKDYENQTLLHFACKSDNLKLVKYLLKLGLDLNSLTNDEKETPVFTACYSGNLDIVKCLASKGSNMYDINRVDENLLFNACYSGNLDLVKYLIDEQKLNIFHKDNCNRSIFFTALESKNLELLDYLLSEELDVNDKDIDGETPLYFAYRILQDLNLIKYLISKAYDTESTIIKYNFKKGADVAIKFKFENYKNILEIAKDSGNQDVIQELQKNV